MNRGKHGPSRGHELRRALLARSSLPRAARVLVMGAAACGGVALETACSTRELGAIVMEDASVIGASGASTGASSGSVEASAGQGSNSGVAIANPVNKRGYAYGYNTIADLNEIGMTGVYWWQNWTAFPDTSLCGQDWTQTPVEYVPTVWGTFRLGDGGLLNTEIPSQAKYLLTFNLPNYTNQANLNPAAAAAQWPQIEALAKARNLKIVSPSVDWCTGNCSAGYQSPHAWIEDFLRDCAGCQIDYIGVSASTTCLTSNLQTDLAAYEGVDQDVINVPHRPIWMTQFSCGGAAAQDSAQVQQFMTDAVFDLENDPNVFRYAWFIGRSADGVTGGPCQDAGTHTPAAIDLLADAGTLTPLGQVYVGLPTAASGSP